MHQRLVVNRWHAPSSCLLQACSIYDTRNPYWAWTQTSYTQALQGLMQQEQLLASLAPDTVKHLALTYWVKCGSLENMTRVNQLLGWAEERSANCSPEAAAGGEELEEVRAGTGADAVPRRSLEQPPPALGVQVVLSFRPHQQLAPFLDLAPAVTDESKAIMRRFGQLQVCLSQQRFLHRFWYIRTCADPH
jgi:hypothetical protein